MEWKITNIGSLCNRVCSGGTPKSTNNAYYNGNIPWLNTKEVNFNRIYDTEKNITQLGLENSSAKWISENSVIVAMYGATAGKVAITKIPITTNQACCNLSINSEIADYNFVYYFLCSKFYELSSLANGGAQQNLNAQIIKDFPIKIPVNLSDQRKIAGILSALDSKIENNNKINANLEAQAQALFKSWFVDFTPFKDQPFVDSELGPIPQGWKVGKLGDYCECVLGGTPSRKEPSYWNGDIAWINSGEVNRFRICTPSEFITSKGLNNSATKMLPAKTTVLAITGATLGQTSILEIDSCANQSVVGIKQNDNMPYEFIYPTIKVNIKRLINLQTGGAQQHINKENIKNLFIVYPPKFIMQEYKEYTKYIYCNISTLCFENQRLAALRDTLLPKLMSGEIKL